MQKLDWDNEALTVMAVFKKGKAGNLYVELKIPDGRKIEVDMETINEKMPVKFNLFLLSHIEWEVVLPTSGRIGHD